VHMPVPPPLSLALSLSLSLCARARARLRVCVCACVSARACVCVCVCVCARGFFLQNKCTIKLTVTYARDRIPRETNRSAARQQISHISLNSEFH